VGGLRRETADVNVIWDLMIHDLDIALQLLGAYPCSVSAVGAVVATQDIDIARVELGFPGGCLATLIASRVSLTQVRRTWISASGTEWLIDYLARAAYQRRAGHAILSPLNVPTEDPLHSEQEAFLAALETRRAGPVDARCSLPALRLAEQISQSITQVHPSDLPSTLIPYLPVEEIARVP
jgi:predicted dehydrogenase